MSQRLKMTPELLAYLKEGTAAHVSHKDMAEHLDCCVDTIKRMLSRYSIESFDGAKYAFPPETLMWIRPCMSCGDDKPRPKNIYFCNYCRPTSDGLCDQWDRF